MDDRVRDKYKTLNIMFKQRPCCFVCFYVSDVTLQCNNRKAGVSFLLITFYLIFSEFYILGCDLESNNTLSLSIQLALASGAPVDKKTFC